MVGEGMVSCHLQEVMELMKFELLKKYKHLVY